MLCDFEDKITGVQVKHSKGAHTTASSSIRTSQPSQVLVLASRLLQQLATLQQSLQLNLQTTSQQLQRESALAASTQQLLSRETAAGKERVLLLEKAALDAQSALNRVSSDLETLRNRGAATSDSESMFRQRVHALEVEVETARQREVVARGVARAAESALQHVTHEMTVQRQAFAVELQGESAMTAEAESARDRVVADLSSEKQATLAHKRACRRLLTMLAAIAEHSNLKQRGEQTRENGVAAGDAVYFSEAFSEEMCNQLRLIHASLAPEAT